MDLQQTLAGGGAWGGRGVTEVITVCSLRTSRLTAAAAINNNDNFWCTVHWSCKRERGGPYIQSLL